MYTCMYMYIFFVTCELRNLEIAQTYCAISRLSAQFPDSKNAQRNLEIAQIPKLRGTYTQSACSFPAAWLIYWMVFALVGIILIVVVMGFRFAPEWTLYILCYIL